MKVIVGTYTTKLPWVDGHGKGIYSFDFNEENGSMSEQVLFDVKTDNPTYLVFHEASHRLFTSHEVNTFQDKEEGAVSMVRVGENGEPNSVLSQTTSGGKGPCHIAISSCGKYLYIANYDGGSISCISCDSQNFQNTLWTKQHESDPTLTSFRQDGPHCHSVNLFMEENLLLVSDLGNNHCFVYQVASNGKPLEEPQQLCSFVMENTAGPRHIAIHPSLPMFYVLNELNNTISSFKYTYNTNDRLNTFEVENVGNVSSLPDSYTEESFAAALKIASDGKTLIASNRGHDSLASFQIDESGKLKLQGHQNVFGKSPRDFFIMPSGKWVIVVNQDSDNGIVFERNEQGDLTKHSDFACPSPVCILSSS